MERRTVATALRSGKPRPLDTAELDEFNAAEVLADGVRAWLTQLPAFAGIAVILHAPLLLVTLLPPLPGPLVVGAFLLAQIAAALLVKAALVKAVLDAKRGLPADFLELVEALRNALAALAVGVRILGRAAVGLLLLVPGLKYLAETFAAVPAVIIEGGSTGKALLRSQQLTQGVRTQVLGICLLIWAVAIGLTLLAGVYKPESLSNTTWVLVYLCTRALDTSLAAVLSATTYHHLCERPEPAA
jgi:hypothetical protein